MHEDHRQRVRERYIKNGLSGFADHNALELLLFYSIPRKDTNELAHKLISQFGSLKNVLEADYEKLINVDGVGENTAVLLTMIPKLQRLCADDEINKKTVISSKNSIENYLKLIFNGVKDEVFYLICLDSKNALINCCKVSEGGSESVSIRKKHLLETAFQNNAHSVILAHNHPNGISAPSREDVSVTLELIELFGSVGIKLTDHFVYAGSEITSMASTAKFKDAFI